MNKSHNFLLKISYLVLIVFLIYSVFPIGIDDEMVKTVIRLVVILCLVVVGIKILNAKPEVVTREVEVKVFVPAPVQKNETPPQIVYKPSFTLENISFENRVSKETKDFDWESLAQEDFKKQKEQFEKDFESVLNKLLLVICDIFGSKTVAVFLLNSQNNMLYLKTGFSSSKNFSTDVHVQFSGSLPGFVIKKGVTILEQDIPQTSAGINYYFNDNEVTKSFLGTPLREGDSATGVLIVDSEKVNNFSERDKSRIEIFAQIVDELILIYDDLANTQRQYQFYSSLYDVSVDLSRQFREEDVISQFSEIAKKIFKYDRLAISFYENEKTQAEIFFTSYSLQELAEQDAFPIGYIFSPEEGLNGYVLRKNTSTLIPDLKKDPLIESEVYQNGDEIEVNFYPRYSAKEKSTYGYRSFLAVPLNTVNKLGIISVESLTPMHFDKRLEEILNKLAVNLSTALDRANYYNELKQLASTDGLTRIPNRRAFDENLAHEVERAKRYDEIIHLIMIDIDFFKKFNDDYGHLVGDAVLKGVAQKLKKSVRNIDILGRFGGEEFAVVLINTDTISAISKAEILREEIEKEPVNFDGKSYKVTISLGVAKFDKKTMSSVKQLIDKADKALYESKAKGRNRVTEFSQIKT
ncbi:diguanylate cyclase [bacterium]|nr:diguanylate cyclase [bacterium]